MGGDSGASREYAGRDQPFEHERERLTELARQLDPHTQRAMRGCGLAIGWHCLEIGAAVGSMSRWLAEQVGPEGRIVACDIDTRFLNELELPNLEVRQLDVRSDALEPERFDLAYCRTLLLHLPEPVEALRNMLAALKPGGWLLVQEPDVGSISAENLDHPEAEAFSRSSHKLYRWLRDNDVFDPYLGRRLRGFLEDLALEAIGCDATTQIVRGGSPEVKLAIRTLAAMEPLLRARGALSEAELALLYRLYRDPGFGHVNSVQFAAWGRKPTH